MVEHWLEVIATQLTRIADVSQIELELSQSLRKANEEHLAYRKEVEAQSAEQNDQFNKQIVAYIQSMQAQQLKQNAFNESLERRAKICEEYYTLLNKKMEAQELVLTHQYRGTDATN